MNVEGQYTSRPKKTLGSGPSTDKVPTNVKVTSPAKKSGKRKKSPVTDIEEVRTKMTRVSVETSSADLDTRDEPNMEAAAQSIPPVDLPELTLPLTTLVDSDFRYPLFQVQHALLLMIWK